MGKRVMQSAGLALLLGLFGGAEAHPMPSSVVLLDVHEKTVQAEVQLPVGDLGFALGQTLDGAGEHLLDRHGAAIRAYLPRHIRAVTPDGQAWTTGVSSLKMSQAQQTATGPYQEVTAELTLTPPAGASVREFTFKDDAIVHQVVTHSILVSVRRDWQTGLTGEETAPAEVGVIRLNPVDNTINTLPVKREGGSAWQGFASLFKLGVSHIAAGTDHLLFLLTLLLPATLLVSAGRWQGYAGGRRSLHSILKIVTAFTVGHSITLILATLLRLHLPSAPVEALIALSILVSAAHALRPLFPGRELLVAGCFGLIHGMAFSFVLAEMNLSASQLALSLLGFNLGIEAMQLLVIALTMPWLMLLARTPAYPAVRTLGGGLAFLAALGWLGERLGWENPLGLAANSIGSYGAWLIAGLAGLAVTVTVIKQFKARQVKSPAIS